MGHPLALEIIQQAVDSKVDQVAVKVAASAGFLVCSLTNHTRIQRTGNEEVLVSCHDDFFVIQWARKCQSVYHYPLNFLGHFDDTFLYFSNDIQ